MARKSQAEIQLGSLGIKSKQDKKNKNKKYGRNLKKCAVYRMRVGKPLGKGVAGNKRGKNHS